MERKLFLSPREIQRRSKIWCLQNCSKSQLKQQWVALRVTHDPSYLPNALQSLFKKSFWAYEEYFVAFIIVLHKEKTENILEKQRLNTKIDSHKALELPALQHCSLWMANPEYKWPWITQDVANNAMIEGILVVCEAVHMTAYRVEDLSVPLMRVLLGFWYWDAAVCCIVFRRRYGLWEVLLYLYIYSTSLIGSFTPRWLVFRREEHGKSKMHAYTRSIDYFQELCLSKGIWDCSTLRNIIWTSSIRCSKD